jgi:hypothetical protein
MHKPSRCLVAGIASVLVLALVIHPAAAQTPLGAATPQALVERLTKAAADKNFAEMVACLDPQSRTELSLGLLMGAVMMVAFMAMASDVTMGMAEEMAEALSGEKMGPEEQAKMEEGKTEADARIGKARTDLSALFRKHGLPDLLDDQTSLPEEDDAAALLAKVDQPALATDLMQFIGALGDGVGQTKDADSLVPVPRDVKNYSITGDRATAQAGDETLEFLRLDGRWFLKAPGQEEK